MIPHQTLKDHETTEQRVLASISQHILLPSLSRALPLKRIDHFQTTLGTVEKLMPAERANYLANILSELVSSDTAYYKDVYVLLYDHQNLFFNIRILNTSPQKSLATYFMRRTSFLS